MVLQSYITNLAHSMLQEHGGAGGPLARGADRAILQAIKHANDPPDRRHGQRKPNRFGGDEDHTDAALVEIQRIERSLPSPPRVQVDIGLVRQLSAAERERRRVADQERAAAHAAAVRTDRASAVVQQQHQSVINALHRHVVRSGGSLRGNELGQFYREMPTAKAVIQKLRLRGVCDSSGGRLRFEADGGTGTIHSTSDPIADEPVHVGGAGGDAGGGAGGNCGRGQAQAGGHAQRPKLPAAIWEPIFKNFLHDPQQPGLPEAIVAAATHQHWKGHVRLLRKGQCIVTKEGPAPDETGAWFVEDGALTLVWDKWYAEGLKPRPPPSPPGCFEYPEHRFTLDFGALHHKWCPTKACKHGAECRRLNCGFWHPVVPGSRRAQVEELRSLETHVKNDRDTLALLRTMREPEDRLVNLRLSLEEKTRRLDELRQQLH